MLGGQLRGVHPLGRRERRNDYELFAGSEMMRKAEYGCLEQAMYEYLSNDVGGKGCASKFEILPGVCS